VCQVIDFQNLTGSPPVSKFSRHWKVATLHTRDSPKNAPKNRQNAQQSVGTIFLAAACIFVCCIPRSDAQQCPPGTTGQSDGYGTCPSGLSPTQNSKGNVVLTAVSGVAVVNGGRECWNDCGQAQGSCSWCGAGLCCRKGDSGSGCDGVLGCNGYHCCVATPAGSYVSDAKQFWNRDTLWGRGCYLMYERVATWTPARGLCHSLGANLAPIFKQADSEAARYYGTSYGIGRGNEAWIGVYRTSTSSPWCVERGTSAQTSTLCVGLQYTRWDSGQPINNGGSELYVFVKTAGTWEDYGDSPSWWFVCHQGFACASCTVGKFSSTSGLSTCASCALGSYQDIAGSSFALCAHREGIRSRRVQRVSARALCVRLVHIKIYLGLLFADYVHRENFQIRQA
jgi:hypothetical protein